MIRKDRRQFQAHDRAGGAAVRPAADAAGLFARAGAALQSGRFAEAEALFRELIAAVPGDPAAHNWLGVACQQQGKGAEALTHLRKAVELAPASADFANNLGIAELKHENFDAARQSFEKAVSLNPGLAQAHYNLGLASRRQGRLRRAIACFRRAIALAPNYGNALLSLANALSDAGEHDEAIAILQNLVAAAPNASGVLFNLAAAFKNAHRFEEAAEVARRILANDPDSAVAFNLLALFQWSIGHNGEAEAAARRAVALDPDDAESRCTLGTVLASLGRFDEAVASFDAALAVAPHSAEALYGLASATKRRSTPEFAARCEAALADETPPDKKALLHFGLGKVLDDLGRYAEAFENFRAGNELLAQRSPFDAAAWVKIVERTIAAFTPEFFAARASFGSESRRPVFIVGMPRSGTTLVEQIIASHPDAAAGGELEALPALAAALPRRLGGATPYPECVASLDAAAAHAIASDYLAALDNLSRDKVRVTDKLPANFLHLGLIALLFPHASIVHCRRDPLDTGLSCYFSKFSAHRADIAFAFSLEGIGAYYRGYERLMSHWREVLPIPMLEVDYEDMSANQEAVSRRLVAHCGLPWDDRCLAFHKTERAVQTASMWQVRQPLYGTSVGRWKRYEPFIGPLRAALAGDPK